VTDAIRADVASAGITLAGYRWEGAPARTVVLLHAGVCDSRSWQRVAPALTDLAGVWAYDRPGFGGTPPTADSRDHVADAVAFLDANVTGPAWLVGSSAGGAVALDVALVRPDKVAGLVLLAPAISGAPDPALNMREQQLGGLIDRATQAGDLVEANRYEVWFWLDGPEQPEGRVGGPARLLALDINRTILTHGAGGVFDDSVDAWNRLDELTIPVTVAVGDYDATFVGGQARQLAAGVTGATFVDLHNSAHLPYLDLPEQVIGIVQAVLRGSVENVGSGLPDGVVVGEDDTGGVESLQPVEPRRDQRQRLVPVVGGSPGQRISAVAGSGVVALSGDHDSAVGTAYDQ